MKELTVKELADGIHLISINRPDSSNALTRSMWQGIPELIDGLSPKVTGIVLTGVGPVFASGADLEEMRALATADDARQMWHSIRACFEYIYNLPFVTVAAVNGPCIGGGCLLASMCDFRIASHDALFGVPIAKFGIILDDQLIARIAAIAGAGFARELLLLGSKISAKSAQARGFIHQTVDRELVVDEAVWAARVVASNSNTAVAKIKKALNNWSSELSEPVSDEDAVVSTYTGSDFRDRIHSL